MKNNPNLTPGQKTRSKQLNKLTAYDEKENAKSRISVRDKDFDDKVCYPMNTSC